jgi:hypothetical protein
MNVGKAPPVAEERDNGGALAHPVRRGMRRADYRANLTAAGLLADGAGARSGDCAPGSYFLSSKK